MQAAEQESNGRCIVHVLAFEKVAVRWTDVVRGIQLKYHTWTISRSFFSHSPVHSSFRDELLSQLGKPFYG